MRRPARRAQSVLALALVVPAALAGCTSGGGSSDTAALVADYATVDSQYHQIQTGLDLPKGVSYPAHMPGGGGRYVAGAGTVAAQNYWFCAWLWTYLEEIPAARGQSRQAVQELPKYAQMDAYTGGLDARGRGSVDAAIQAAQQGTTPDVRTFAQTSCGGPFYGQARGTASVRN
ncbi:MAG: hypothetical protein QOJ50_2924 [Cryptosporangiaceae bacterium]|nr:hypothetical protein [Cryptosporangiaceae bacterium]